MCSLSFKEGRSSLRSSPSANFSGVSNRQPCSCKIQGVGNQRGGSSRERPEFKIMKNHNNIWTAQGGCWFHVIKAAASVAVVRNLMWICLHLSYTGPAECCVPYPDMRDSMLERRCSAFGSRRVFRSNAQRFSESNIINCVPAYGNTRIIVALDKKTTEWEMRKIRVSYNKRTLNQGLHAIRYMEKALKSHTKGARSLGFS